MRYSEFRPQTPISQLIECFWSLESETETVASSTERILPDGCVEVILNFAEPFAQHDRHSITVQPRNFIVGQMTGPIFISPTGSVQLIGIRFHPSGTAPFFRLPMHELTNQVVEWVRSRGLLKQNSQQPPPESTHYLTRFLRWKRC